MHSVLIVVFDGLQPSQVTPELMPNLARFVTDGVRFTNHHPVYPTVTRVNAASMVTGRSPGGHGIAANTMMFRDLKPNKVTPVLQPQLAEFAARGASILTAPTLADTLARSGQEYIAIGVGTSGNAYVHNPRADVSGGATIHPEFTLPTILQSELEVRFGQWPDATLPNTPRFAHAVKIMTEYILPERNPRVALIWSSEPDKSQHDSGVGSDAAHTSIFEADREFGKLMGWMAETGRAAEVDVMVLSDHGYSTILGTIEVENLIREAGFPAGDEPGGVAVAANGGSVLFYTYQADSGTAEKLAVWLMQQPWCGAITASSAVPNIKGTLPASLVGTEGFRAPDLAMSFRWDSNINATGYPGHSFASGLGPGQGQHGSMSKHELKNVLFSWGPSFKSGVSLDTPSGNIDLAPTVLQLLGITDGPAMDGRILEESLTGGTDPSDVEWSSQLRSTERIIENGVYRQQIAVSRVGETTYVDEGSGSFGPR